MHNRRLRPAFVAASVLLSAVVIGSNPAVGAADPVPGQLAGLWVLPLSGGNYQDLLLADSQFKFFVNNPSGGFAFGNVSVSGNTITFYSSNQCSGTGTYEWSVSNHTLTFHPITYDPCPRAQYLPRGAWTRP